MIRLFIFDDRVEIVSPGVLPDDVTEEMIRRGVSKPRNPLLFDNAKYLLPYTGIGSGILRALKEYSFISFENSYQKGEFKAVIVRQKVATPQNAPQNAPQNTPQNTPMGTLEERILGEIRRDGYATQKQMAEKLGLGFYTVKEYVGKLKRKGRIRRVGSDRVGHWEVMD